MSYYNYNIVAYNLLPMYISHEVSDIITIFTMVIVLLFFSNHMQDRTSILLVYQSGYIVYIMPGIQYRCTIKGYAPCSCKLSNNLI